MPIGFNVRADLQMNTSDVIVQVALLAAPVVTMVTLVTFYLVVHSPNVDCQQMSRRERLVVTHIALVWLHLEMHHLDMLTEHVSLYETLSTFNTFEFHLVPLSVTFFLVIV